MILKFLTFICLPRNNNKNQWWCHGGGVKGHALPGKLGNIPPFPLENIIIISPNKMYMISFYLECFSIKPFSTVVFWGNSKSIGLSLFTFFDFST